MKLRYSHHNRRAPSALFFQKALIVTAVVVMAFGVPIQLSKSAFADKYDDRINALQQEVSQFQAEAARLSAQAQTLQGALATLANEKSAIQTQIDLSQAKYDKLVADIAATEAKIKDNQDVLGDTIADLYVDGKVTPLEMLASSKNVSDYLDKQEARNSVREQLTATISQIKNLKTQLDQQKVDVEKVLAEQNGQKEILITKENEQANLLAQTQGQESAYQQLSAQRTAEMAAVQAQQRAAIAALTNGGQNSAGSAGSFQYRNYSGNQGSCGGGYPSTWCSAPLDAYVDSWALYTRECVSYAAWAAQARFGKHVTSFSGSGHAYQWPNTASSLMGANVDNTPTVGSVAITPRTNFTPLGHAMVVEEVYGDGWVRVSQYNFAGTGEYSTMDLKITSAVYVHFQDQ
jgi:peptidoglycan hydrolase CwlO-like protein